MAPATSGSCGKTGWVDLSPQCSLVASGNWRQRGNGLKLEGRRPQQILQDFELPHSHAFGDFLLCFFPCSSFLLISVEEPQYVIHKAIQICSVFIKPISEAKRILCGDWATCSKLCVGFSKKTLMGNRSINRL